MTLITDIVSLTCDQFRFFMHPLYESYKKVTSGKQEGQDFHKNVFQWIQSSLSLGNLRKGINDYFNLKRHL
jgi:hypothetical protein